MHMHGFSRDIFVLFISLVCFILLICLINACTNTIQDDSLRRSRHIPTPPLTPFSEDLEDGMFS